MDYAKEFNLSIPEQLDEQEPLLVVDSQQDMRLILAHHLGKLQFTQVKQCRDALEALELMRRQSFSVVICSMDLPEMSGLDLLHELREDSAVTRPAFCLSMANVSKEKLMLAVETGVDEILVKPFTLGDTVPKLRKAFRAFNNPKNPERVYELAKKMLRTDKLDEAERIYTLLSQSAPDSARPLVGLARIELKRKAFDAGFAYLKSAEAKNPSYVHLFATRGEIYLAQTDYANALTAYKKSIELSPLNPVRYQAAGEILVREELYQEAAGVLEAALARGVSFGEIYNLLSQCYYSLKDYKNSGKSIRKALEKDPDNTVYLNQLALSLKELGELEEAKKYYNQVLKLDPENKQGLFNKSIMLAQSGKMDEAIKLLERLVKTHPDFDKGHQKLEELRAEAKK